MSSKTPTTWIDVVQTHVKAGGPGTSLKDVFPKAKIEWAQIKDGSHPTKMVGKAPPRKSKKNKKEKKHNKSFRKGKKQHGGSKLSKIKHKATAAAEAASESVENDYDPVISSAKALSSAGSTTGDGQNMGNFSPGSDLASASNNGASGVEGADIVASTNLVNAVAMKDLSPAVYSQSGGLKIIDDLSKSLEKAQSGLMSLKQDYSTRKNKLKNTADKVKARVDKVRGAASGAKKCVDTHVDKLNEPDHAPHHAKAHHAKAHHAKAHHAKAHHAKAHTPHLTHSVPDDLLHTDVIGDPYPKKPKVVEQDVMLERIQEPGKKPFWVKVKETVTQTKRKPRMGGTKKKRTRRGGKASRTSKKGGRKTKRRGGRR